MADHDIQTSQKLLKDLEGGVIHLRELMRQVEVVSHNLKGTWIAISVTHGNWKRKVEEDYDLD
jgi:hypothetical protein